MAGEFLAHSKQFYSSLLTSGSTRIREKKVSGVHLGTVIGEVWKEGVSIENSVRMFKDTGIFS